MIPTIGYGILVLTLLVCFYGTGAAVYGAVKNRQDWIESARLSMLLTFPLLSLASAALLYLLITGRYEVAFVYSVTQNAMEPYLRATAWWGGQAGSLLFWSWLLSAFTTAVTIRKWDRDREFLPWVVVVSLVTVAFFISLNIFFENPFERYWITPQGEMQAMFPPANSRLIEPNDGRGLNPLLRHWGMIIHPPMLYLGFVAFVIPYAFAVAALITGRSDDRWIRLTRRWTLVAWLFLSLGLVLGGRWAYDVLGWGGYWGWDPVEIAAFMPWLTGTAFLHSVMIQEKRGLFKRWNMVLIILTYSLVIFGTFLTRSGVLSSVHAFAQSAIGPMFFAFIAISFLITLALMLWRWNDLHSDGEMYSLLSREALFLVNNLLFVGILAVCFWGVIFPLISELFTGQKVTVGPPFYERATGPLFAGLLLLMGIAPLSAWGHSTVKSLGRALWKPGLFALVVLGVLLAVGVTNWAALTGFTLTAFVLAITLYDYGRAVLARTRRTGENMAVSLWRLGARNRRRYGGYIIHLGVVLMAVGVVGIELFQAETQGTIRPGESLELAGYTMTYKHLDEFDHTDGRNVARAIVEVAYKGQFLEELYPRRDYYYAQQQPMTIADTHSNLAGDDLYVLLVDWQPISINSATFKVYHNPLVNWMWIGSIVFILGTAVAAWPDRDPEPSRARAAVRRAAARSVEA